MITLPSWTVGTQSKSWTWLGEAIVQFLTWSSQACQNKYTVFSWFIYACKDLFLNCWHRTEIEEFISRTSDYRKFSYNSLFFSCVWQPCDPCDVACRLLIARQKCRGLEIILYLACKYMLIHLSAGEKPINQKGFWKESSRKCYAFHVRKRI